MKTAWAVSAAAVVLLAGCASPDVGDAAAKTAATGGPTASDTPTTESATTSTTTTAPQTVTAAPVPTAIPTTFTDVNQTITDGDLKEAITVKRIAREIPWPAGYAASAKAYELVGLEMTWTPSKDYTIPIRKQDLTITTGSQFPGQPSTLADDALKAAGWALLPDAVDKGDPVTGWVVFKVDPRDAPKLVLSYQRPAVKVTAGGTGSFDAKTFTLGLVG